MARLNVRVNRAVGLVVAQEGHSPNDRLQAWDDHWAHNRHWQLIWRWRWDLNSHTAVSASDRGLLTHLYLRRSEAMLPKRGDRREPLQSERFRGFCDQCVTSSAVLGIAGCSLDS